MALIILLAATAVQGQRKIGFGQNFSIYMNITQERYEEEKHNVMAIIGFNITVENDADELVERKLTDIDNFEDITKVSGVTTQGKKETMVTEALKMEKGFLDGFTTLDELEQKGQVDDFLSAFENPFNFRIDDSDVERLFEKEMSLDEFIERLFD